ncbi:MAG TPA: NUDIX hydrolase [Thermobifida alba]|nr:NUDIX hydrolase [Thermobifida alba]
MSELDYARLPATRGAAGALIRADDGRLLLVHRAYGDRAWGIPGGIIETGESPRAACLRELREELGVEASVEALAAVDWVPPAGAKTAALQWLFTACLPPGAEIRLPPEELSEYTWARPTEAARLLPGRVARRVAAGLQAGEAKTPVYLEDGRPV